jgi:hypothetical protein
MPKVIKKMVIPGLTKGDDNLMFNHEGITYVCSKNVGEAWEAVVANQNLGKEVYVQGAVIGTHCTKVYISRVITVEYAQVVEEMNLERDIQRGIRMFERELVTKEKKKLRMQEVRFGL